MSDTDPTPDVQPTVEDSVVFDGIPIPLAPGQSVGSALVGAGIRSWRTTRRYSRPRGLFCAIGICYDCLVTVDGMPDQRACLTPARPGMRISSGRDAEADR